VIVLHISLSLIYITRMKTQTKLLWVLSAVVLTAVASSSAFAGTGCLGAGTSCNTPTTVNVTILPGDICIGSEGSFDFGSYTVSSSAQDVNGSFTDHFWVDDLKGADVGYYTTVQMSGNLVGPDNVSIPAVNVSMKTPSVGAAAITTIAGTANTRVEVAAGMSAYQTLDSARQLIIRNNAVNFWVIGKYGVTPDLQLSIPAYQSVGSYAGTLVYTLYTN